MRFAIGEKLNVIAHFFVVEMDARGCLCSCVCELRVCVWHFVFCSCSEPDTAQFQLKSTSSHITTHTPSERARKFYLNSIHQPIAQLKKRKREREPHYNNLIWRTFFCSSKVEKTQFIDLKIKPHENSQRVRKREIKKN